MLESSSDEDDYVDAAMLAKDPALAFVLKNKPARIRPARTKTHSSI